jgi:O-antigen/teichoic acid export membrane protein
MNTETELLSLDLEEQSSGEGAALAKPLRDAKRLTSSVALTLVLTSARSLFAFHILGPTLMGAWRSAATVDTVHEIARMGVVRAISIRVPVLDGAGRRAEADEIIAESGSLMVWLGVALAIGIFASSFLIANHDLRVAMQWMAPLGLVTEPYVFLRELAAARHRFDLRSKETIFRGLVELAAAIALCATFKLAGLGAGIVLSVGLTAIYLYRRQTVPFRWRPRLGVIRTLIRTGAPFSLSEGAYELIRRTDVLIMAVLLGPTSVGYYAVSRLITDFSTLFCQRGIAPVLSPHLLHTYGRTGSVNKAAAVFENPARLLCYTVPAFVGVATILCGTFIQWLLPQYVPGIAATQITLWTVFFVALHSTVGSFIVAAEIVPAVLKMYAILIPAGAIAECVVLKAGLGLRGAAWCTLAILSIIGAAEIVIAKRKCGDTYRKAYRFITSLYFPVLCAISLTCLVETSPDSWFVISSRSIFAPFVKSLVFLLLYTPILAIYEKKFSLLRMFRQAS